MAGVLHVGDDAGVGGVALTDRVRSRRAPWNWLIVCRTRYCALQRSIRYCDCNSPHRDGVAVSRSVVAAEDVCASLVGVVVATIILIRVVGARGVCIGALVVALIRGIGIGAVVVTLIGVVARVVVVGRTGHLGTRVV